MKSSSVAAPSIEWVGIPSPSLIDGDITSLTNSEWDVTIALAIHSYNICTDKVERNGSHLW